MYKVDCWRRVCDHDTFLRKGTALKTKAKAASLFSRLLLHMNSIML